MIHLIYDMDEGLTVPDNKVLPYTEHLVLDLGTIPQTVDICVGSLSIVRSVIDQMKQHNVPNTNVTISYAHSDSKVWINENYQLEGVYDFCNHDIDVLMRML